MNARDLRKQKIAERQAEMLKRREQMRARFNSNTQGPQQGQPVLRQKRSYDPVSRKSENSDKGTNPDTSRIWAYGITTVPQRFDTYLPRTILSLRNAGFDDPILFVDGEADSKKYVEQFGLKVTNRCDNIKLSGNYILALYELVLRHPKAHCYVIFQDDIICCKGLREYLDNCEFPDKGYFNLITYPQNEALRRSYLNENETGWYPSNQMGRGAQGLIFSYDGALTLLSSKAMIDRYETPKGYQNMDGGIIHVMRRAGFTEYVHYPSLINHIGDSSTVGHPKQPTIGSFRGEDWDVMQLLRDNDREDEKDNKKEDTQENKKEDRAGDMTERSTSGTESIV